MKGEQIKQVLVDHKHQMKDIAEKMGTSLSNLSAGLSKSDVRTGLLEKIAEAAGLPISVFYGETFGPVQSVGDNNTQVTQVAGNYTGSDQVALELLKMKDEQLSMAMRQTSKAQEQMDRVLDHLFAKTNLEMSEGINELHSYKVPEAVVPKKSNKLNDGGGLHFYEYPPK